MLYAFWLATRTWTQVLGASKVKMQVLQQHVRVQYKYLNRYVSTAAEVQVY